MNASAHRLSRVPQRAKASKPDQSESFAASFFANNPDVQIDTRPPIDKIEEIEAKLSSGPIEDNERFNLLVQKKSLCFLAYGEASPESIIALADIGAFYNQQNRPESSLRHLGKAQILSKTVDLEPEDKLLLAVELAEATLAMKATTKQENAKYKNSAMNALQPVIDIDADDKTLVYRRDLLIARATSRSGKYDDTLAAYKRARQSLKIATEGNKTATTANLYTEMAETAERAHNQNDALKYYRKAHDTLVSLDMNESARLIEQKMPTLATTAATTRLIESVDDEPLSDASDL